MMSKVVPVLLLMVDISILVQARGTRCYNGTCNETNAMSLICDGQTCGNNTYCLKVDGRSVCSCLQGYTGNPLYNCVQVKCLDNSECSWHQVCVKEMCIEVCQGACGINADCQTRNHQPVCLCPPGYTGNPFTNCHRFDPSELCHPSPCGMNTQCEVVDNIPTCKCLPGYHGSPIRGCQHECNIDFDCGPQSACIDFKCQNLCYRCGINAECKLVENHMSICKCPTGYYGDPMSACYTECNKNSDCPPGKPVCISNSCKDPCNGVCGANANCNLRNGVTPVCSCPKDMTGDPFVSCRPFTKEELCEPNPCGVNAICHPGYDRNNNQRPVCTCLSGYVGNSIIRCIEGDCINDNDCSDDHACFSYRCQNRHVFLSTKL